MLLSDFDFDLPVERIAQRPPAQRDAARMLVLDRQTGSHADHTFTQLPDLLCGDELIVLNNSRVIPARLFGRRAGVNADAVGKRSSEGGPFLSAPIEVLLLRQVEPDTWEALVRPGRKIPTGERIFFPGGELEAEVTGRGELGMRV